MTLSTSGSDWLVRTRPTRGAALRLFCFPYAGAGASAFNQWGEHLPAEVEVCAVQLPGRENRLGEDSFTRLQPMIDELVRVLMPYCDIPFAFYGHCMGGFIAFELARRWKALGAGGPSHLFISGCRAPHLPDDETGIHHLPQPEFVHRLREMEATPDFILADEEMRELFLPVLRADFTVYETYAYEDGEPLRCPISAFGGADDPRGKREDLRQWSAHTESSFIYRTLPGGHLFIHSSRDLFLRFVAEDLRCVLRQNPQLADGSMGF
ncbi:MAG TPA: alpha/beta fold hydrolase [Pyrinomonadaceae bacterium]|nr:alpha/beta fold hydrolase [Pyrinomonadaceae bacterium]